MLYIAADHAGFELKETIKAHLIQQGHEVEDMGAYSLNPGDDYSDFVVPVARKVAQNPGDKGIVLGGSGQGEAIAANKIKGIRAAVYYGGSFDVVKLSRQHNDANILSLGARFLTREQAFQAVKLWLSTSFEGGRHKRRILKIEKLGID